MIVLVSPHNQVLFSSFQTNWAHCFRSFPSYVDICHILLRGRIALAPMRHIVLVKRILLVCTVLVRVLVLLYLILLLHGSVLGELLLLDTAAVSREIVQGT
jgi:hypothetical protein